MMDDANMADDQEAPQEEDWTLPSNGRATG